MNHTKTLAAVSPLPWQQHLAECGTCAADLLKIHANGRFLPLARRNEEEKNYSGPAPTAKELKMALNKSDDLESVTGLCSWSTRLWLWIKEQIAGATNTIRHNKLLIALVLLIIILGTAGASVIFFWYKKSRIRRTSVGNVGRSNRRTEGLDINMDHPKPPAGPTPPRGGPGVVGAPVKESSVSSVNPGAQAARAAAPTAASGCGNMSAGNRINTQNSPGQGAVPTTSAGVSTNRAVLSRGSSNGNPPSIGMPGATNMEVQRGKNQPLDPHDASPGPKKDRVFMYRDPDYNYYWDKYDDLADEWVSTGDRVTMVPRFKEPMANWADEVEDELVWDYQHDELVGRSEQVHIPPDLLKQLAIASHHKNLCLKCETLGKPCYQKGSGIHKVSLVTPLAKHSMRCIQMHQKESVSQPHPNCMRCSFVKQVALYTATGKLPEVPQSLAKDLKLKKGKNGPGKGKASNVPSDISKPSGSNVSSGPSKAKPKPGTTPSSRKKGKGERSVESLPISEAGNHKCVFDIHVVDPIIGRRLECECGNSTALPENGPPSNPKQGAIIGGYAHPVELPMTDCFLVLCKKDGDRETFVRIATCKKIGNGFQFLTHTIASIPRPTHIEIPHFNGLNNPKYFPLKDLKYLGSRQVHPGGTISGPDGKPEVFDAEYIHFFLAPSEIKLVGTKFGTINSASVWHAYLSGWHGTKQKHMASDGPCKGYEMSVVTDWGVSGGAVLNVNDSYKAVGLHMQRGKPGVHNVMAPFKEEDRQFIEGPFPSRGELNKLQEQNPFGGSPGTA